MTIDNLKAAFNGESNARNKYLAFAKKADEEGYGAVASLFRAAAEAEAIHAAAHARVIEKMGGQAVADIQDPEIKSTSENLVAAIAGESYERDVMYPDFIKQAKAENIPAAIRTCENAMAAEAEHAKLYQDALDNLPNWKGGKRTFYVCPVCGYTSSELPKERCPVCGTLKEKFKAVS